MCDSNPTVYSEWYNEEFWPLSYPKLLSSITKFLASRANRTHPHRLKLKKLRKGIAESATQKQSGEMDVSVQTWQDKGHPRGSVG